MDIPWQIPFSKSLCLYLVLAIVAQFLVDRTLEALDALSSLIRILTAPLTAVYTLIPSLPFALTHVLLGTLFLLLLLLLLLACAVVTALLLCGHVVEFVFDDEGSLLVDVVDCPDPEPSPPPVPLPYPHCIWKTRRLQLPIITITPPPPSELELRDLRIREAVEERDRTRWKVELSWLQSNESALVAADPKAYREAHEKVKARAYATHVLAWILYPFDDRTYSLYPKTLKDIQIKGNYEWAIAAIEKHRLAREARKPQIAERLRLKEEEWAAKLQLSELLQRPVEAAGEESSGSNHIDASQGHREESRDTEDITSKATVSTVIPKGLKVDAGVITDQQDPARLDGRAVESTLGTPPVNEILPTLPASTPLPSARSPPMTPLILVELVSSNHDHGTPTTPSHRLQHSHLDTSASTPHTDGPSTPLRSHTLSTSIAPSPSCTCAGRSHRRCGLVTPLSVLSDSSDFEDESDKSDVERSSSLPTSPTLEPKLYIHCDDIADDFCDLFDGLSLSSAQDFSIPSIQPQVSDCVLSNGTINECWLSEDSSILGPLVSTRPSRDIPDFVATPATSSPVAFEPAADILTLAAVLGSMPLATLSDEVSNEKMDDDIQRARIDPGFTSESREPTAMDGVVVQPFIPQSTSLPEAPRSIFSNFQFAISIPPQNVVPVTSSWQYSNERMDAEPDNCKSFNLTRLRPPLMYHELAARMVTDSGDNDHDEDERFVSLLTNQMTQVDANMSMTIDANEISSGLPFDGHPVATFLTEHLPNDSMDIIPESSHPVATPFVAPCSVVDVQMAENPFTELPALVPTDLGLLPEQLIAMEFQITPPIPSCDLGESLMSLHSDASQMGGMDISFAVIQPSIPVQLSTSFAPTPMDSGDTGSALFNVAASITRNPLEPGFGTTSPPDNHIPPQSLPNSGFKSVSGETPLEVEGGDASSSGEKAVISKPDEHPDGENQQFVSEMALGAYSTSNNEEFPAKDQPTSQLPQRRLKLITASSASLNDTTHSRDDKRISASNFQSGPTTVSVFSAPAVVSGEVVNLAVPHKLQAIDSASAPVAQSTPEVSNLLKLRNKRGSLITGKVPGGNPIPKPLVRFAKPGELVFVKDETKDVPKPTQSHPPSDSSSVGTTTTTPAQLVTSDSMETNSPQVSASVVSPPPNPQIGTVAVPTAWSRSVKSVNSRFLTRKESKPKAKDEEAELAEFLASRATAPKTPVPAVPITQAASSKSQSKDQASTIPIKSAEIKRTDNSPSFLGDASPIEAEILLTPMGTLSDSRPVRGLPTRATQKSQTVRLSEPQKSTIDATMMSTSEIVTLCAPSAISFDFAGGTGNQAPIPAGPLVGDELEKTLTDAFEEIHHQDRTRERHLKHKGGKLRARR